MMYKLTKGNLSRIRKTEKECKELMKEGYTLDGKVDATYKVIDKDPFTKKKEK